MSVTLTLTDPGYCEDQTDYYGRQNDVVNDYQIIKEARESELISFENTTQGLGLKVCGGCSPDGKEDYGIFIKRVLPGGLAEARTDEIRNGDLILEVNGQSMQGITYDRAVSILRQASASNHVEMNITRDAASRTELAEFQMKFGMTANTSKMGSTSNESGADVGKKDSVYRSASLDLSDSFDRALSTNTNGHISPTSSHGSEVANHLMDAQVPPPPPPHSSISTHPHPQPHRTLPTMPPGAAANAAAAGRETPVDALDSLLSRKLIKDPNLKLHIDQLEAALSKLGLELTAKKHQQLRESLTVDDDRMVRFEEFAKVIKTVFRGEMGALKGRMTPLAHHVTGYSQQGAAGVTFVGNDGSLEDVVKERDALRAEVAALKDELKSRNASCKQSEEQLLFIRKQAQSVIEEGRTLRTKLHLSEQAHQRAQQTERDYEEVVAMLENEVAQLRMQGAKSDTLNMQKRLAVLVCQLKKAESGIKTYEVATEKLVKHIEYCVEVLSGLDKSPRVGDAMKRKDQKKKALSTLASEGRDVIKLARSLMETVALPFGWEEAYTSDGVRYYINHLNQTTTWTHPVSCMEHQTNVNKSSTTQDSQQQQPPPPPPPPPPAKDNNNPESQQQQQQRSNPPPPPPPPLPPTATATPSILSPAPNTGQQHPPPPLPHHSQSQQQQQKQQQQPPPPPPPPSTRQQYNQQQQNESQQEKKKKAISDSSKKSEKSTDVTKHSPRRGDHKESGLI